MSSIRIKKRVGLLAVLLYLTSAAASAEGLDSLSFLVGHWRACVATEGSGGPERCTEEFWTDALGGVMVGLNRDYREGRPAFFEYLRIESRDNKLVYVASPKGALATEFTLVEIDGERARFENEKHDWPQRIEYRRSGTKLELAASGIDPEARVAKWLLDLVVD